MSEYTKGPWTLQGLSIYGQVNGTQFPIAAVSTLPCIGGHDEFAAEKAALQETANSRLMAASPELLEACKKAYDTFYGLQTLPETIIAMDLLESAIAKAEGK